MAQLALVRHGQSEWNAKNLWTGWVDEPLTDEGLKEADLAAEKLRGVRWDYIFESDLLRVKETTEAIRQVVGINVPVVTSEALRERNYGVYTEKNKEEIHQQLGNEEYEKLRRGWDYPIPDGESLKQVYERIVPYFVKEILPKLKNGKNVVISSSGNALRALHKYLKKLSDQDIEHFELATGESLIMTYPIP